METSSQQNINLKKKGKDKKPTDDCMDVLDFSDHAINKEEIIFFSDMEGSDRPSNYANCHKPGTGMKRLCSCPPGTATAMFTANFHDRRTNTSLGLLEQKTNECSPINNIALQPKLDSSKIKMSVSIHNNKNHDLFGSNSKTGR